MVRDGSQEHLLYRVAEILDEKDFPDNPYTFGNRKTSKRLLLEFGEAQQWFAFIHPVLGDLIWCACTYLSGTLACSQVRDELD